MDMNLPEVDGWEATRTIRRRESAEKRGPVRIMGLTAHAMKGDLERCLEAGCDDYDTKPVEFARLLEKIRTLLGPEQGTPS
jgi:CheY-like chemotaxis protein